jgi:hypothetical protein
MSTEVVIPREQTYKLNPGRFRAKIQNVTFKKAKGTKGQNCCLHFEAQVPGMERYECCARAVFPLDLQPNSQLRTFLEGLLGTQFFSERAGQPVDLNAVLRNKDCEIDLVHGPHDEDRFDWPMVLVANASPATPTKVEPGKEGTTK